MIRTGSILSLLGLVAFAVLLFFYSLSRIYCLLQFFHGLFRFSQFHTLTENVKASKFIEGIFHICFVVFDSKFRLKFSYLRPMPMVYEQWFYGTLRFYENRFYEQQCYEHRFDEDRFSRKIFVVKHRLFENVFCEKWLLHTVCITFSWLFHD